MTTIERALNSIGKKCFIDFYEDFKECKDKNVLAKKLLEDNPNAKSLQAQLTRINYAQWIIDNHKEREALTIICGSSRLDDTTKQKARKLLNEL